MRSLFDFVPTDDAAGGTQLPALDETPSPALPTLPPADDVPTSDLFASGPEQSAPHTPVAFASGEKAKARDILAAIRTLKTIEQDQRPATAEERQTLVRFAGFGPVALSIFTDPITGRYKDANWQAIGDELKTLTTSEEYNSA